MGWYGEGVWLGGRGVPGLRAGGGQGRGRSERGGGQAGGSRELTHGRRPSVPEPDAPNLTRSFFWLSQVAVEPAADAASCSSPRAGPPERSGADRAGPVLRARWPRSCPTSAARSPAST